MTHDLVRKLGLGSVQWGMNYGVANATGRPDSGELRRMLAAAEAAGVTTIDTAFAYGAAETVIGELSAETAHFDIITKTAALDPVGAIPSADAVLGAFRSSLERLRRPSVYGLLVHNADMLLGPQGPALWAVLEQAKTEGLTEKIGVSVYDPGQLAAIMQNYRIGLVQLPFNIYDQRFQRSGAIAAAAAAGIEVHVRSAFLQGLLLMDSEQLPRHFDGIREHHAKLHAWYRDNALTPLYAALRFALEHSGADKVVVGAENALQLREILEAAGGEALPATPAAFAISSLEIVNPSLWKL